MVINTNIPKSVKVDTHLSQLNARTMEYLNNAQVDIYNKDTGARSVL